MSNPIKSPPYNPAEFIRNNVDKILPARSRIKDIVFNGYEFKAFHSQDRPIGLVVVDYISAEESEERLEIFVKHSGNASFVHNSMSRLYNKLKKEDGQPHIPKPILYDEPHHANFMEFFEGTELKYRTLLHLALSRRRKMAELFQGIGKWLHGFHQLSKMEKTISISGLKDEITAKLEKTAYFTGPEKETIRSILVNQINPSIDELYLVKPHNDFTLRNILHVKPDDFVVVDWDAMFHKKFPSEAPIWNDITYFVLNILSLARFPIFITGKDVDTLANAFIKGYFRNDANDFHEDDIPPILYLFTLRYYLGLIGDRSLPQIYSAKLGKLFLRSLKKKILAGKVFQPKLA